MSPAAAPPWLADASTAQRVLSAWEQLLDLLDEYGERLALEQVDLDPEDDTTTFTRDHLLRASGKEQDRLLGAFKQHVRRQVRTETRTELDIACDFLVNVSPPSIKVPVKRRGRKARWDPRAEALFATAIWKLMGDPDAIGLPGFRTSLDDLRPLRRKAVERYQADHAPEQSLANLLDRFREAFPRNPYLRLLLELAEDLHHGSWLDRHEALCIVGGWFHERTAGDQSGSPRPGITEVFRVVSTQLAAFAAKRPPVPLSTLAADAGLDARGEPRPARGAFHDLLEPDAGVGER